MFGTYRNQLYYIVAITIFFIMNPTVYIESTVVSYVTAKPSRDLIVAAHQQMTTQWWDVVRPKVDCFISPFVIQEISAGDKAAAKKRFDAVGDLPVLEVNKEIQRLAQRYFDALEISEKAKLDASHLAVAVWHEIDYLLSWNCKHIVSGRVKKMLEKINTDLNIVEEVRKQRLRIEVNCENDFDKLFEQAIEIQKKFKNRVVSKPSLEPRLQTPPEVV